MNTALKEALLEVGRLVFFAAISIIITFAIQKFAEVPQTEIIIIATTILRFLDKWVHEHSKEIKTPKVSGIAPF